MADGDRAISPRFKLPLDPGALTDYPFRTGLAHCKPTLSLDSSQNPQRNEVASSAEALFNLVNSTEHGG